MPVAGGSDGRRIEIDVESFNLAVPYQDEVLAGVARRFARGARAPNKAAGIVQRLRLCGWRIDVVRMGASQVAREFVDGILPNDRAGRSVHRRILGVDLRDRRPPAFRIILTEDSGEVAPQ